MKLYAPLLALVAALFLGTLIPAIWLLQTYVEGMSPFEVYGEASATPRLIMTLGMLVAFGTAIATAVLALVKPARRDAEIVLGSMAGIVVGLGLLGGLLGEAMTRAAMAATGTTSLAIIAPTRAESLLTITFGAFGGLVALSGAALLHQLWKRRRAA